MYVIRCTSRNANGTDVNPVFSVPANKTDFEDKPKRKNVNRPSSGVSSLVQSTSQPDRVLEEGETDVLHQLSAVVSSPPIYIITLPFRTVSFHYYCLKFNSVFTILFLFNGLSSPAM